MWYTKPYATNGCPLAMEAPISLHSEDIRAEKVKALKSLRKLEPEEVRQNFVRGQYDEGVIQGQKVPKYRDEDLLLKIYYPYF